MLRRRIPSTNSLFTFEAVARLGSFSHAAKELNVTQPAISRSVSSFETHLGYALFERHGRWIKLTTNGDKLYRATSAAFGTITGSMMEIDQRGENQETVQLSMSPTAVNYWFIPRLSEFREKFPEIDLCFIHEGEEADILGENVDLAIRLSNPQEADMHRWPFADEKIVAVCSPEYVENYGTLDQPTQGDLGSGEPATHTFIEWNNQRYGLDEFLYATGHTLPRDPNFLKFSDYSSNLQSAIEGQGIALAWVTESSRQIIDGNLVLACSQIVKTGRRYHLLASNLKPLRPAVETVRDWLINQMRQDQKQVASILQDKWDLF